MLSPKHRIVANKAFGVLLAIAILFSGIYCFDIATKDTYHITGCIMLVVSLWLGYSIIIKSLFHK